MRVRLQPVPPDRWLQPGQPRPMAKAASGRNRQARTIQGNQLEQGAGQLRKVRRSHRGRRPAPRRLPFDGQSTTRPLRPPLQDLEGRRGVPSWGAAAKLNLPSGRPVEPSLPSGTRGVVAHRRCRPGFRESGQQARWQRDGEAWQRRSPPDGPADRGGLAAPDLLRPSGDLRQLVA